MGEFHIVGASPEILVRQEGEKVTVRPIAGTRKRGATPELDAALAAELCADPKELAEHLMLIDLGRNDLGRIAKIGSVKVTEQYVVERYSHVMHLVSNVDGRIREGVGPIDLLRATFPAGTVTGTTKVRAMDISVSTAILIWQSPFELVLSKTVCCMLKQLRGSLRILCRSLNGRRLKTKRGLCCVRPRWWQPAWT
jgi:hypothetical protein